MLIRFAISALLLGLATVSALAYRAQAQDSKKNEGPGGRTAQRPLRPADSDSPLPEGWPDATIPGRIEIKNYPAYRSAVAEAKGDFGSLRYRAVLLPVQPHQQEPHRDDSTGSKHLFVPEHDRDTGCQGRDNHGVSLSQHAPGRAGQGRWHGGCKGPSRPDVRLPGADGANGRIDITRRRQQTSRVAR